jgi:hypothetical protein
LISTSSLGKGRIRPGAKVGPHLIRWTYTYNGEEISNGLITANMEGQYGGWLRILIGSLDQWIDLVTHLRRFGGRQWYFECPVTHPALFGVVDAFWRKARLQSSNMETRLFLPFAAGRAANISSLEFLLVLGRPVVAAALMASILL